MILGTDISIWNDDNSTAQGVDFAKMKQAGARFCFIKATQANFADSDYTTNWKAAKGIIPRGAYHFLTWNISPIVQARFHWSLLKDDPGEFVHPIVDFEWWGNTPPTALSTLRQYCDELMLISGRVPMIYTSAGFFNQFGKNDAYWAQFPLWIANYTEASKPLLPRWPWKTWTFWQYTAKGDGKRYGCESNAVDLNRFNGDEAAFRKLFNLGEPAPVTDGEKLARLWGAHPELW